MKSELSTCRLFVLLIVLLVSLTTGELEFFQDVEAEPPEDVNLNNLELFLEGQNHHGMRVLPHFHPPMYEDDLGDYTREREKNILETLLLENPKILKILENNKLRGSNYQQRPKYNLLNEYSRATVERNLERPYVNLNQPSSEDFEYPKINIPYLKNPKNLHFNADDRIPLREDLFPWENFATVVDDQQSRPEDKILEIPSQGQEFTYHFGESEFSPFAVRPDDPRYYQKDEDTNHKNQLTSQSDSSLDKSRLSTDKASTRVDKFNLPHHQDQGVATSHLPSLKIMPEPQRRAELNPIIVSTINKANNDVYFIAIVAGCSAAAMFALVLISLTWCKLQRGAKAAADIEYPAYGVTGPNKDVSPSGDQRLAHSAQMYHFQHQKQQIIAMEKTAASRDPGSISEAESDEENEEGDYTVYECPGLAPAGEMEVKNPLFDDDPTPATPHQTHKNEEYHR